MTVLDQVTLDSFFFFFLQASRTRTEPPFEVAILGLQGGTTEAERTEGVNLHMDSLLSEV